MSSRPVWSANVDSRTTYTGSTALQTFVTLGPFKFQPNSTNLIFWGATVDGGTTGTDVSVKLYEGASFLDGGIVRTSVTAANGGLFNVCGFSIYEAGASPSDVTLTLQYGVEANGSQTVGIQDGYLCAFPLGAQDQWAAADSESTITAGSWAAGTEKVELQFTPATAGAYTILAKCEVQPQTAATDGEIRLWDGTTAYNTVDNWAQRSAGNPYGSWLGGYHGSLSGAQSWKVQAGANANSIKVRNALIVALRDDDLCEVQWAESRGTSTTTSTSTQVKTSFTHTAKARPHLELASATLKHSASTNAKFGLTAAGSIVDATSLVNGSTTATNYLSMVKMRLVTPSAGSRTLGVGYSADTTDTTTIEEAWVLAIRPNVYMPPRIMGGGM